MKALACSITSGVTALLTIVPDIEIYLKLGAALIAIASGIMAIRYYHYAIKEKKLSIKNLKP